MFIIPFIQLRDKYLHPQHQGFPLEALSVPFLWYQADQTRKGKMQYSEVL